MASVSLSWVRQCLQVLKYFVPGTAGGSGFLHLDLEQIAVLDELSIALEISGN